MTRATRVLTRLAAAGFSLAVGCAATGWAAPQVNTQPSAAVAQQPSLVKGRVVGALKDESGAVIRGGTVEVRALDSGTTSVGRHRPAGAIRLRRPARGPVPGVGRLSRIRSARSQARSSSARGTTPSSISCWPSRARSRRSWSPRRRPAVRWSSRPTRRRPASRSRRTTAPTTSRPFPGSRSSARAAPTATRSCAAWPARGWASCSTASRSSAAAAGAWIRRRRTCYPAAYDRITVLKGPQTVHVRRRACRRARCCSSAT